MTIKQYDHIMLKDGRTATIVEELKKGKAYLADIDLPGPDWDTVFIDIDDIKNIIPDKQYVAMSGKTSQTSHI